VQSTLTALGALLRLLRLRRFGNGCGFGGHHLADNGIETLELGAGRQVLAAVLGSSPCVLPIILVLKADSQVRYNIAVGWKRLGC
jgi:hypothetical protein